MERKKGRKKSRNIVRQRATETERERERDRRRYREKTVNVGRGSYECYVLCLSLPAERSLCSIGFPDNAKTVSNYAAFFF